MTRFTVEDRTDRLQRRDSGFVERSTLAWSALRLNVALSDAERATGWRKLSRRHWALPWLVLTTGVLAFDVLVKVTAALLDLL